MSENRDVALVNELRAQPAEANWLEFKHNNTDPEMIGLRCAALSNSARLEGKDFGYMVWGVEDGTHAVVGTDFNPDTKKKGNEPLPFWLEKACDPARPFVSGWWIIPKGGWCCWKFRPRRARP